VVLSNLNGKPSGLIEPKGKMQCFHRVSKNYEVVLSSLEEIAGVSSSVNGKLSGFIEF